MGRSTLAVRRHAWDIEEPWNVPAGCTAVPLRRATDAAAPRLATTVAVWRDAECLTVLFSAADDHVCATYLERDAPLYEEDAFELFVAPERLQQYYEIEISPVATLFDALVDSPDGTRATMTVDRAWTAEGLFAAVRKTADGGGAMTLDVLVRLPFSAIAAAPQNGDIWRANFFRIDRHPTHGDEFSAWQPTLRTPADFHVAEAFGELHFSD